MNLFSTELKEREQAASKYRTFSRGTEIPKQYAPYWRHCNGDGDEWPNEIAEFTSDKIWPEHAFGTANAALVIFWHRPGLGSAELPAGAHIGPRFPVLGGSPHPHVKHWPLLHPSPSWRRLQKYLSQALSGLGMRDCFSQVMIACINPIPGATGSIDTAANSASAEPGGAMDIVTQLCRPRVVLLCGRQVQAVGAIYRKYHSAAHNIEVPHPLKWDGHGGEKMKGDEIARLIRDVLTQKNSNKNF